jgi:hypothetical protein
MYRITIKRNPAVLVIVFLNVVHEVERGRESRTKKLERRR